MSVIAQLKRRYARRKREHARAWRLLNEHRRHFDADPCQQQQRKGDLISARLDECRLILNELKLMARPAKRAPKAKP